MSPVTSLLRQYPGFIEAVIDEYRLPMMEQVFQEHRLYVWFGGTPLWDEARLQYRLRSRLVRLLRRGLR